MSVYLAAEKIRADIAGLTGSHLRPPTTAMPSPTEVFHTLVHGESGSLHYLWDSLPAPVLDAPANRPPAGPHGGFPHPDALLGHLRPAGPVAVAGSAFAPVNYPIVGARNPEQVGLPPSGPVPMTFIGHPTEIGPSFA